MMLMEIMRVVIGLMVLAMIWRMVLAAAVIK
jgi:hypothetical protein